MVRNEDDKLTHFLACSSSCSTPSLMKHVHQVQKKLTPLSDQVQVSEVLVSHCSLQFAPPTLLLPGRMSCGSPMNAWRLFTIVSPHAACVQVRVEDSLFVGQSRPEVCTMCAQAGDPGCAPKLSSQSYNQVGECE